MANASSEKDFEVMKRYETVSDQKKFNFNTCDRFVPSRYHTKKDLMLLTEPNQKTDILSTANNFQLMRKNRYENSLKSLLFNEENQTNHSSVKQISSNKNLLREDWKCHLIDRKKFLPDFETMEKRSVGIIEKYIWSNHSMIAAISYRNVCCYDPFKGFTRVIDFSKHPVSDACFSNDGRILVVTTFKQILGPDVFIYKVNSPKVMENGIVSNRNFRSHGPDPVICLCFTKTDNCLITGDINGNIKIYQRKSEFDFIYLKNLEFITNEAIEEIKFSCNFVYLGTLNSTDSVTIWNGGSLTPTSVNFALEQANTFEWHPFVEDEFVVGTYEPPALYLCSVAEKRVVAYYKNWDEDVALSSFCFKKQTGEIFANFFFKEKQINRVLILASMDQVVASYEFDDSFYELKLILNGSGTMLGAGGVYFKFSFWTLPEKGNMHSSKKLPEILDMRCSAAKSVNEDKSLPELKSSNLHMHLR